MLLQQTLLAGGIVASFTLGGYETAQCFVTIPALLIDFPPPDSSALPARAALLARQWRHMGSVGHRILIPAANLSAGVFIFLTACCYLGASEVGGSWRLFALCALLHVASIVHTLVNMLPINEKLDEMDGKRSGAELAKAEHYSRRWIRGAYWRVVFSFVAGMIALLQTLNVQQT